MQLEDDTNRSGLGGRRGRGGRRWRIEGVGRGRGRGRQNRRFVAVAAPNFAQEARYDSGDEDQQEVPVQPLENPFPEAPLDDDIDDILDGIENINFDAMGVEAPLMETASHIVIENIGNPDNKLNYDFVPGTLPRHRTLMEKFGNLSPTELVLHFALPFFEELRSCSNERDQSLILMCTSIRGWIQHWFTL